MFGVFFILINAQYKYLCTKIKKRNNAGKNQLDISRSKRNI